jgi:hypothetical protein
MHKTYRSRKGGATRKRRSNSTSLDAFQKEITVVFFEMLLMIKLFHWKTYSYPAHKASDDVYSSLNDHMDKFIEVLLGKSGKRINLMNHKSIKLMDLSSQEQFVKHIQMFKSYLVNLDNNKALSSMSNSDLYNIRDEILGDMNKLLYLLTLK